MAIVENITADCGSGALSRNLISRQWDNKGTLIQFAGYPEPQDTEQLIYRLIVWMRESEDGDPAEQAPIELEADQWLISNVYTQFPQTIRFQLCITNEAGTYEKHSPIFSGNIGRSLSHSGEETDIDVSTLFDPYKKYVDELIIGAGAVIIDQDLDTAGAAADAKATGDALAGLNERLAQLSGGLTDEAKYALLACFEGVAWAVADGQDRYNALELALFPPAELTSISAVYTQGGTVYDSDSLNDLKEDLVVTAHYSDSTTEEISNYTLSGTLAVGTSTITVGYGGKTATFSVTVTAEPPIVITSESANVGFGAMSITGAPTYVTTTNKNRAHAMGEDLLGYPCVYGYKYTISVTDAVNSSMQINPQVWNTRAKQAVENAVNGNSADYWSVQGDWTTLNNSTPVEITPPESVNGYAPAFLWINFRKNSSNANFSAITDLGTITITKERVS